MIFLTPLKVTKCFLFIWLLDHFLSSFEKNVFLPKVLPRMNCLPHGVSASPCRLLCAPCWPIFAPLDAISAASDDMLATLRKIKDRINFIQERISTIRIIYTSVKGKISKKFTYYILRLLHLIMNLEEG